MALIPGFGPMELAVVLVIVLLLFGPKRLPQLGKSLGKTVRAIRDGVEGKGDKGDKGEEDTTVANASKQDVENSEETSEGSSRKDG
ncbi:MAG: twin-arginine translocase TatA/TatE family subunit [Actinobacteria bacterium]|nr:twin-arginine translocase TatA/TatE family subunit [Actinomycetota bacterium]